MYDTIIATAKELKMPVEGHIPMATSVEYVLNSGQSMIAHFEEIMKFAKEYTPEQVSYYASLAAKSNVWITSTLSTSHQLNNLLKNGEQEYQKPELVYLHPQALGVWNYVYPNIYKPIPDKYKAQLIDGYNLFQKPLAFEFYKKGGKMLLGSDCLMPSIFPGVSLINELQELVDAGLKPYEALKISTTNSYEFLNELNVSGTIEEGKNANLVLLDENPLVNISNTRKIFGLITQNKWIPKTEIDKRLAEIAEKYSKLKEIKFN
jgi:hypothetical protein